MTAGEIFHTYSSYARGLDPMLMTYNWLDLTPKGRDEDGLAFTWLGFAITTSMRMPRLSTRKRLYVQPAKADASCCSEKERA